MKIKILIKENLDKIYNILPLIQLNEFLKNNQKDIEYFNELNWANVFSKAVIKINSGEYEKICVFDDEGILPFIFFTKHKTIVAANPTTLDRARLCRAHNNANCLILSCKELRIKELTPIIDMFFMTQFEAGRHALRIKLMQEPFVISNEIVKFDQFKKETILICSDHGGYTLKENIKKHLIDKQFNVIDYGCFNPISCHYPLFAIAMSLNASKAFCGISVCSTGIGIANTMNKFKGINATVCINPQQAEISRQKFNANVLGLGALNFDEKLAIEIVDKFISTPIGNNESMNQMNNFGYKFDKEIFDSIELPANTEIPKELKE